MEWEGKGKEERTYEAARESASEDERWGRRVRWRRWEEAEALEERERKREWYGDKEEVGRVWPGVIKR